MEKLVVFRDYQEQQSADHNNLQLFARSSFDDLVNDAVTQSLRYTGFNTVKSNQAEITVAPGRFYGTNSQGEVGAVYVLNNPTVMSMVAYLAVASQRIVTLVAYGVENQTDIETRDFLTNVTTQQTEPMPVPMWSSRDATLAILQGTEGADPQPPPVSSTQVAIANILMDTSQVVSITMLTAGLVTSTEDLNERVSEIEAFDNQIAPRVDALASSLADLMKKLQGLADYNDIILLMQDMAEVKDKVGLPSAYAQYGSNSFLWPDGTQYDLNNSFSLGWNAQVQMGCRFPAQNANVFALAMFNPIDPNAHYTNGLLLPAFTNVLRLQTGGYASSTAMGQYGYQTYELTELQMPFWRIVNGGSYIVCTNGVNTNTNSDITAMWWLPNFQEYQQVYSAQDVSAYYGHINDGYSVTQYNYYWVQYWTEPYWTLLPVNHTINGAQLAQSWLVPNDMWVTQIGIWIQSIASPSADVWITLCGTSNGQPDLTKTISHQSFAAASLKTGWNLMTIQPSFCQKGDRMAVVVTCAANHQMGMTAGGSYLNGTFFYSLDGVYYLGDFTKEMMLQIWGASFNSNQVTIEFTAINLQGGIRDIDITARMVVPGSTQLIFEVMPDGTGTWLPIGPDNPLVPFQNAPVLCRFRGRFVGTPDVAAGITLPDSICKIWCPGPNMVFVSEAHTLVMPSNTISLRLTVENFNPVAHTISPKLYAALPATGAFTFTTNPVAGTTIGLNGSTITFVASGATGNQANVGVNLAATLSALVTNLNQSTDPQVSKNTYALSGQQLNLTFKTAGTIGNSYSISTNVAGASVSGGGLLAGGSTFGAINPSATTTTLVDSVAGRYYVQCTFPCTGITTFNVYASATTNSVANVFHIAEDLWWAL